MQLALLWTDIVIWVLVFFLILWGWNISRSPRIKRQWYAIFKSPIAVISSVILLFYLFFALLDSVHFKFEKRGEMLSLMDMAFQHRIENVERTYSAPFATVEYTKSIVMRDGNLKQINLPLKYVSKESILKNSIIGVGVGLIISTILIGGHLYWRKRTSKENGEIPWNVAYGILVTMVTVVSWLYIMSFHYHVLGTDKVGGDVLYQSFKSIRTGILIGVLTTLLMVPIAIFLGVSAGLFRGWVDDIIQYIYTTLNSIPAVLLIGASVLLIQLVMDNNPQWFETTQERSDFRLLFLVLILGVTSWTGLCRLLRAETLKISQMDFVMASKAFGVGKFHIIRKHIIPNLTHIILISVVLDFSSWVLTEAVLSYVGIGVDPTMYSWGNMINQARLEMAKEPLVWWSLFSSFIFMFILVLSANLFSDRVQTVLDPRNKV